MKKLYFLFFLPFLFAVSCHKETGPTTVNGTVRDVTNNTPVADSEVGLVETDGESSFGLGGTLLEEKYADASGNFTFDFTARKNYQYYVYAIKDQYYNDQSNNVTFVDNLGEASDLEVFLQPEGYLKFHIMDAVPHNENSEFRMTPFNSSFWVNAFQLDTILTDKIYGNSNKNLFWVLENFTTSEIIINADTIYCPAFDTTYFEILY